MRLIHIIFTLLMCSCAFSLHAAEFAAHRGANRLFPENSVEAARAAWACGALYVEGDFHLTDEGKIICLHGPKELKALTGSSKPVVKLTVEDLAALDLAATDPAKKSPVRIPTLIDIMRTVPKNGTLVVEIKTYGERFAELLDSARKEAGLRKDQIILIDFKAENLADFSKKIDGYRALWLCKLKQKNGKVTPDIATIIQTAKGIGAVGVDIGGTEFLTQTHVDALKRENLLCWTWTVDDDAEIARQKAMGVDLITTDRIHEVLPPPEKKP